MRKLTTDTKTAVALQLRSLVAGARLEPALAAIEGLGELGGPQAITHIEELMETHSEMDTPDSRAIWAGLIRAYGRAGRFLPE